MCGDHLWAADPVSENLEVLEEMFSKNWSDEIPCYRTVSFYFDRGVYLSLCLSKRLSHFLEHHYPKLYSCLTNIFIMFHYRCKTMNLFCEPFVYSWTTAWKYLDQWWNYMEAKFTTYQNNKITILEWFIHHNKLTLRIRLSVQQNCQLSLSRIRGWSGELRHQWSTNYLVYISIYPK